MKRYSVIAGLILTLVASLSGQEKQLSPEAQNLNVLLIQLKENPYSEALKSRYLLAFPETVADFEKLFDPKDFSELYDGYEYIMVLKDLMSDHSWQVGCLVLNLSKDAKWRADAFNYLQQVTALFARNHTKSFVAIFKTYNPEEQNAIISFLADGVHSPAKGYSEIIERLRELDENELAQRFVAIERKMRATHPEN